MQINILLLCITAASIAFIHTLIGVDHYIPFIVISRARTWSIFKTSIVTIFCGIGHVLSSVVLGFIGIAAGLAINKLVSIESSRGNLAGWLLIAFGLVYTIWGIRTAIKNKPHKHLHFHDDGSVHEHHHKHFDEHSHIHDEKRNVTPWVLFLIFIFGPCEPLIPLVMYPAASHNYFALTLVTLIFGIITISTMLVLVGLGYYGIKLLPMAKFDKYIHALAGFAILMCGVAMQFMGI